MMIQQVDDRLQDLVKKVDRLEQKYRDKESTIKDDRGTAPKTVNIANSESSAKEQPVNTRPSSVYASNDIFINGIWSNRYYQYGVWHGPFSNSMKFNTYNNTTCIKPAPYDRGFGYSWQFRDGFSNRGMFQSYEADHGAENCEQSGLIVHPK
ncbi:unnamed protein product [Rotaria sordida]|uniref:Uncharacterized protein n=1 Tax=Rotaria sordida TaxID=392033 RepID=A0A815TDA5_9BILA|nr:unnamed protein product [Rotaria sordida]CAF1503735.1 unnamed protein product [Rotaria sordida]